MNLPLFPRRLFAGMACCVATYAVAALPSATTSGAQPECTDAMRLAKAMYASTAKQVYAPLSVPSDMQSRLVLGASALDISGGDALESTAEFAKTAIQGGQWIYWASHADGQYRIVMHERGRGWQGDRYSLYLLDKNVSKERFSGEIEAAPDHPAWKPLLGETWRPPLVFQSNDNGGNWLIDVGPRRWNVYASGSGDVACTISFVPPGKDPVLHLPAAVRDLVRQLDEALGSGTEEGTLQPTARIRMNADALLINAAFRPWALTDGDAYNSRQEVDTALRDWARASSARRRLHGRLVAGYPRATRALATYYAHDFGLSPHQAGSAAAWTMDLIFRAYFVFHKNEEDRHGANAIPNPWPSNVREQVTP